MSNYNFPTVAPGFIAEPYHIPGYGGHIPTMRIRNGASFGRASRQVIEDPCVAQASIPVLLPGYSPSNCSLFDANDPYVDFRQTCSSALPKRPSTACCFNCTPQIIAPCCPTKVVEVSSLSRTISEGGEPCCSEPTCQSPPIERKEKFNTCELPEFNLTQYPSNWPLPKLEGKGEIEKRPSTSSLFRVDSRSQVSQIRLNCCGSKSKKFSSRSKPRVQDFENARSCLTMPIQVRPKTSCYPIMNSYPPSDPAERKISTAKFEIRNPVGCTDLGCCENVLCRKKEPRKKAVIPCEDLPCCNPGPECGPRRNQSPNCPCDNELDRDIYRNCEGLSSSYAGHIPGFTFHSNGRTFGKATLGSKTYMDKCMHYNTFSP